MTHTYDMILSYIRVLLHVRPFFCFSDSKSGAPAIVRVVMTDPIHNSST